MNTIVDYAVVDTPQVSNGLKFGGNTIFCLTQLSKALLIPVSKRIGYCFLLASVP